MGCSCRHRIYRDCPALLRATWKTNGSHNPGTPSDRASTVCVPILVANEVRKHVGNRMGLASMLRLLFGISVVVVCLAFR
jgi:hypothetical protein